MFEVERVKYFGLGKKWFGPILRVLHIKAFKHGGLCVGMYWHTGMCVVYGLPSARILLNGIFHKALLTLN